MGVEIRVEGLTKAFGRQVIWQDVTLTLPAGEISVMLGPSGTGKSVFLKTLVGLLKPERGSIVIQGKDITRVSEHELYQIRKLFGVLFQDGALFGSQNLYDNIAFPLREHTKKGEKEIRDIVMEKMEMVGLLGAERKLPGEISGGMRKRAGLARALVLDPEIILFDEPDSGLDPVRTAYLNQLIVDLNAQIEATFLIVTHDINTARTVPDNIGLLFRRNLVMFGPREQLLTSDEPVVRQFLNGRKEGPIGMAEEKDAAMLAAEADAPHSVAGLPDVEPQLRPSDGLVRRSQRHSEITTTISAAALRELLEGGGSYADLAAQGDGGPASRPTPAAAPPVPAPSNVAPDDPVTGETVRIVPAEATGSATRRRTAPAPAPVKATARMSGSERATAGGRTSSAAPRAAKRSPAAAETTVVSRGRKPGTTTGRSGS